MNSKISDVSNALGNAEELAAQYNRLKLLGARFIQPEFADINGYLRAKISGLEKGLSPSGSGISSILAAVISGDTMALTPFSNFDNGFPKMVAVPDPATAVHWPWQPDMAAVLCDLIMEGGEPCPMDPRHILKKVLARYEALGITPKATLEYEFYIFQDDAALLDQKRFSELVPFGRTWDFYSVSRSPHFGDLARAFLGRMEDVGIDIDAFHTEYGHGMYEYAHGVADPLTAADAAVRGKLYFKQLCIEHGLFATYMAHPGIRPDNSSSGAHHNVSIWRDGTNLMWDGNGGLTQIARHFAAGVLKSLPDLHLIFRPWVNSYRRMNRLSWSPENASWGLDNHSAAVRVVHGAVPSKHSRLEHRVAGADVNPYLTLAAILLAGLAGIEQQLEPPPYSVGDAGVDLEAPALSASLEASIIRFRDSALAQELFGEQFVEHFALVKQSEWDAFAEWSASSPSYAWEQGVSEWEWERYLCWV